MLRISLILLDSVLQKERQGLVQVFSCLEVTARRRLVVSPNAAMLPRPRQRQACAYDRGLPPPTDAESWRTTVRYGA